MNWFIYNKNKLYTKISMRTRRRPESIEMKTFRLLTTFNATQLKMIDELRKIALILKKETYEEEYEASDKKRNK